MMVLAASPAVKGVKEAPVNNNKVAARELTMRWPVCVAKKLELTSFASGGGGGRMKDLICKPASMGEAGSVFT
jgi:hypothetical protein